MKQCVLYNAPICYKEIDCEDCDVMMKSGEDWKFHKYKKVEIVRDDIIPHYQYEFCCPACKRMLTDGTLWDDYYDCKNCDRCKLKLKGEQE